MAAHLHKHARALLRKCSITNDSPRALVIDVEISGSVAKELGSLGNGKTVIGKEAGGQAVRACRRCLLKPCLPREQRLGLCLRGGCWGFGIRVDKARQNRPKEFRLQEFGIGIGGKQDRWGDKVSQGTVKVTSKEEGVLGQGHGFPQVMLQAHKRCLVDHRTDKGRKGVIARVRQDQVRAGSQQGIPKATLPQGTGAIKATSGGALLPLVLKGPADGRMHGIGNVRRRMQKVHILPACLPDNPREGAIAGQVYGYLLVEFTKDPRTARKVQSGKVWMLKGGLRKGKRKQSTEQRRGAGPGRNWMTPAGRPASIKTSRTK